jgi:uncharacterized membrane protein
MSTPSSPRPTTPSRSTQRIASIVLGIVAIVAAGAALWVLVMIATSDVSLGTLVSSLIVVAFFAAVGSFVLRRNFFHRP